MAGPILFPSISKEEFDHVYSELDHKLGGDRQKARAMAEGLAASASPQGQLNLRLALVCELYASYTRDIETAWLVFTDLFRPKTSFDVNQGFFFY